VECTCDQGNYGLFAVEPLESGLGTTIGNALRRVVLSSLPGSSVTWVKIDGVQHEFSIIPHMREDVTEFLLNVKALRLRSLTNRPGILTLSVEGEGYICAADITPSADFEIINPELHLATLDSEEARLYVELNVEQGIGYVPATHGNNVSIGVIPIDAIFTPVRKVNYKVEATRVGPQTKHDKLIFEVWTDGTISAVESVIKGAQILVDQFTLFNGLIKAPIVEEVEQIALPIPADLYNLPIEKVGLTQSIVRRLKRNRITKLGELMTMNRKNLLSLEKFGPKSLAEVEDRIRELGLLSVSELGDPSAPETIENGVEVEVDEEDDDENEE